MSLSVLWLDQNLAKLFLISEDQMRRETFAAAPFLLQSARHLEGVERLLVVGPGDENSNRQVFMERLKTESPDLSSRVVDCVTSDQGADSQIASLALKYLSRQPKRA